VDPKGIRLGIFVSYVLSNATQNIETNARKGQSGDLYVNKKAYRREVNHMMRKRDFKRGFFVLSISPSKP